MPESDKQWYKDAVIYELHVKSFCDGNGDGIGDFKGLISKLDYLQSLGVDALWLLPFYPSPLRDDGYDIADYTGVNPDYGTMADFRRFLKAAHARGLKVITELVLNHTSDQHPWFQKSRQAKPGTKWRDYYVWSDTPDKYEQTRIIFQDFEVSNWTWDPVAKAYFWHRFYSHQPDLNFDNPRVMEALIKVLDFWFDMGVDGMRLDAVPYLYEREGTNCENLPETYDALRTLRAHVEEKHPGRMLLAEANQWPEDAVAYFGGGDMCHMAFHFPLMPRMYMALEMESRYPIVDILEQTPEIPESCQWALFLRNHDELTLEMVTDEERDYMYRMYVQDPRARVNLGIRRRLAPLLDNDRRRIELMNVLLMTLPGSPVIYYGDEIGMGDNFLLGDRHGVRTPMQWSADRNGGFSKANPQNLFLPMVLDPEYTASSLNVDNQEHRQSSLLWWMRRLISTRKQHPCFARGDLRFLGPDNSKILAFVRDCEDDLILVAVNLSRQAQSASLDLAEFAGREMVDVMSNNSLGVLDEKPARLTFSPYGFYIMSLAPAEEDELQESAELPRVRAQSWQGLFDDAQVRERFEKRILPRYVKRQRWFGGKARRLTSLNIFEWVAFPQLENAPFIVLMEAGYQEGESEVYILPLSYAPKQGDDYETPRGSMAWAQLDGDEGAVYEAVFSRRFAKRLLRILAGRKRIGGKRGRLASHAIKALNRLGLDDEQLSPKPMGAEQSNTSIRFGEELILKLYRKSETGLHPDVEVTRHLTERAKFEHTPPYYGHLEWVSSDGRPIVLGLLQGYVKNQGDAWQYTLELMGRFYERVLSRAVNGLQVPAGHKNLVSGFTMEAPAPLDELLSGAAWELADLLGRRTAEMHLALADHHNDPAFTPEPFSTLYQRALLQSLRTLALNNLRELKKSLPKLDEETRTEAEAVLELEDVILQRMELIHGPVIPAQKTRLHGDFHLGQVLYTGKDFVIFDFEGEPARPLSERRLKRSPLRDVAGMLRSLDYATATALQAGGTIRPEDVEELKPWAELWFQQVAGWYLQSYRRTMGETPIIPAQDADFERLLMPYTLEKAVYEMGYELNNRPDWLSIPLRGIRYLCGGNS